MDLRTLQYFVTVAEELNITRAAEKLHMSQPPLSAQIKNLELELETILFIRGKRRLKLTESGQLLYRRAKDILSLSERTKAEVLSLGEGMRGTIAVGLVEGMAPDIAAEWFAGFRQKHPNVRYRILDGSTDDLLEKLRGGIISLAVITSPCDHSLLHSFHVGEERMAALMSRSHPLAQNNERKIRVMDLVGENLIVPSRRALIDTIYKWFRAIGEEPKIVCEMDSYLDAAALAGRNVGISIYPRTAYIPNDSLVFKEIAGGDKKLEYLFVWRKGHQLPVIEEQFIDFVRDLISKEQAQ
ncbi:MAG: LysR family transcriptional regulator [Mogibacterium sp.]|nr:LysR family transcriptional regulator [Mogibacterium sp.]MBR2539249.1 LysR family transcriptional regulator [Mogibacterium sp.]